MSADTSIPFTVPFLGDEEAQATQDVIRSGWVTQGPRVAEFERAVADYCQTRHAIAVSSGTAALHLSLICLGVGPGDEVICPSMSFIATANAICHAGATPVFAEIDPATFNLEPDCVEHLLSDCTKAILLVHQIGLPVDIDRFSALARKYNVKVIEDAACAIGSRYKARPIGGHSEMVCFSFHPRKVITTGEGGMITTNSDRYAEQLKLLRHQGMSVSDAVRHKAKTVIFEDYKVLGYNYRMSDIQAAVGIEQMKKLDTILRRRLERAQRYNRVFHDHPWICPQHVPDYAEPNYQSYAIRLRPDAPMARNELMQRLLDQGIATRRGVMLTHREPPYREVSSDCELPQSEMASANSMLLPLYPALTDEDQDRVIRAVCSAGSHPGRSAEQ